MWLGSDKVSSKTNRGISRYEHFKFRLNTFVPIGMADQLQVIWYYSSSVSVRTLALRVMNGGVNVTTADLGSAGVGTVPELEFF